MVEDETLIIIFIIILIFIFINFGYLNYFYENYISDYFEKLDDEQKCDIMSKPKFMIKDLRTNLWFKVDAEFYKFVPGNFGTLFLLNEKYDDELPLRLLTNPNFYILISDNKKDIRIVKNPSDIIFKLQVFIYDNTNILGFVDENNLNNYIFIDNDGSIIPVTKPSEASAMEILRV